MKNTQLIARFSYENKMFCISLNKDKKLIFAYLDDKGETQLDLTKDEVELVSDVFKSLLVDESRSYYVREEKLNNKLYQIFYDPKTKNYFWKSNTGQYDIEDNIFFNMKYNNMPSVVYFRGDNFDFWNIVEKEYRKEVFNRRRKKIISVLVNAGLSLAVIATMVIGIQGYNHGLNALEKMKSEASIIEVVQPQYTEPVIVDTIIEENAEINNVDNYSWEMIKQAIKSNSNLSDEEKEFLYKLQFVFDENHQYMDLDKVMIRLQTLEIKYIDGYSEKNSGIGGTYYFVDNTIECYQSTSFKEVDIGIFLHEFFHVLQEPSGRLMKELSNEVFKREVMRRLHAMGELDKFNIMMKTDGVYDYGTGYEDWIYIYYYLAELIPQDDLKKYQFAYDETILASALCKGSLDRTKDINIAYQLLDEIDASCNKNNNNLFFQIPEDLKQGIAEKIAYFYRLNGMSMGENTNCFAYELDFLTRFSSTNGQFLLETLEKAHYMEYNDIMMFETYKQMKTYFSDTFPETTIHCKFTGRGSNSEEGYQILKDNGDYNQNYVISVDEELEIAYSNYISNSSRTK